jgi:FemAB-related protein (PEP-CTERM system-associated)
MTAIEAALGRQTAALQAPLNIDVATELDAAAWDGFVTGCPNATGYHEWAWRRVFQRAFDQQPIYLVARGERGIEGVLPLVCIDGFLFGRMLTSLPFVNYGGVLSGSDIVSQALVNAAIDAGMRRRCRLLELRHLSRRFPNLACKQHKVSMHLTLGPAMWNRLDRKVRNQIRKAQKSDLTSDQGGAELVKDFYTVFARNMRDLGTPVYSRRFFDEVLAAFPDRACVTVVRFKSGSKSAPVAAAISYRSGSTTEVPWASSVREYNTLCPNHLLYWSLIEQAAAGGCKVFDFGRSTPHEGTFKFKEQWGAVPVPLFWEYWLQPGAAPPDANPSNPKFHLAIALWKRLPLVVANQLGPMIVRSIP